MPQQQCYNRTLASPHQANNCFYGFNCCCVSFQRFLFGVSPSSTPAAPLQHPCNPLKNSEVSSTSTFVVLSFAARCGHSDWIFTSHLSHNRSFLQNSNETYMNTRNMMISKTYFSLQPFKCPLVTICTTRLTLTNPASCPHSCIYVFCVDLRTNSDYFPIQH